jgi:hypothetical protein
MIQIDDIKLIVTHDRRERQLIKAPIRKWRFSISYDSFVVGLSAVLRLNFCAKNK